MRLLKRIRRFSAREVRLALAALRWVVDARVSLRVLPLRAVYARFDRAQARLALSGACDARCVRDVAIAVRRVGRLVPGATCLPQALSMRAMLARRGVVGELRLGVARNKLGVVEAHAWVEVDGCVVIGNLPDLSRFQRLAEVAAAAQ